jgi:hypothetical protein
MTVEQARIAWVPQACTLPTADQPLRQAEFDALFATAVRAFDRPDPTRLRLTLGGGPEPRRRPARSRGDGSRESDRGPRRDQRPGREASDAAMTGLYGQRRLPAPLRRSCVGLAGYSPMAPSMNISALLGGPSMPAVMTVPSEPSIEISVSVSQPALAHHQEASNTCGSNSCSGNNSNGSIAIRPSRDSTPITKPESVSDVIRYVAPASA